MTLLLSLAAAVYFIVALVDLYRRYQAPFYPTVLQMVVRSRYVWAGFFTLTIIPLETTGHLPSYVVFPWPAVALVLAELLLRGASYAMQHFRWEFSPIITTGILPAVCIAGLTLTAWLLWAIAASAMDPALRRAEIRNRELAVAKRGMEGTLQVMNSSLAKFPRPVLQKQSTYQDIKTGALSLIELADTLAEQHEALVKYHDRYLRGLKDAPELFCSAAQVWRDYAEVERDLGMKEIGASYDEVASMWEAYAKVVGNADRDPFSIEDLEGIMLYVRHRLMLQRLVNSSPPDTAAEFMSRKAQFEANLRLFVKRFDELRVAIRILTARVRDDKQHGVPDQPRATPEMPQHAPTTPPAAAGCVLTEIECVLPPIPPTFSDATHPSAPPPAEVEPSNQLPQSQLAPFHF